MTLNVVKIMEFISEKEQKDLLEQEKMLHSVLDFLPLPKCFQQPPLTSIWSTFFFVFFFLLY